MITSHKFYQMPKNPFVSIIIPFYNIEECVSYCLDSVLAQTFEDYEVVCVDDGSTDNTGNLLDSYAAKDSRIRVLHKKNGGLSDARNFGVMKAKGDYISFVDGDDVVSPYYLEALCSVFLDNYASFLNAMVIGQHSIILPNKDDISWQNPKYFRLVSLDVLIKDYCYEKVLPGAWARLAPKEFYVKHPFPSGIYHEEIATAIQFLLNCEKAFIIDTSIYGYVMRTGSIVHKKCADTKQINDYFQAINTFCDDAHAFIEVDSCEEIYFRALHFSRIYRFLRTTNNNSKEIEKTKRRLVVFIRSNLKTILRDRNVSLSNRIRLLILGFAPSVYCACFDVYEKCIKKFN